MKRAKITWIGNKRKRELHRIQAGTQQPKGCQFDEIPEAHRVTFRTAREALNGTPKYDACAFCTRRFKSRR